MSETTLKLHREDATPAAPVMLTIAEAHRRSGISIGRLRDYAAKKYKPLGLAEKIDDPITKQPSWLISEAADERFAAVRSAAVERKSDLAERAELVADPIQRDIAQARLMMVEELDRALGANVLAPRPIKRNDVRARVVEQLKAQGFKVSEATLKRWHAAWREEGRDIIALVDERRVGEREKDTTDAFDGYYQLLKAVWLDNNKLKKASAITAANVVAHRDGLAIPHDKTARRYLERLEKENAAQVIRYRGGPTDFNNKVLPFIPRDRTRVNVRRVDGSTETRNMLSDEIWCADHHICDTIVEFEGKLIRPWVTAILDIRSNKIVGLHWSPKSPNKYNVLLAFRNAVLRGGKALPTHWFVDNGKDFDAWMFQGLTKMQRRQLHQTTPTEKALGIREEREQHWQKRQIKVDNDRVLAQGILQHLKVNTIHAAPYNARSKPVERFFGIFEEGFGKLTWTYCGSTPQNRPEHLVGRLERNEAPSYADYIADAEEWIRTFHHSTPLTSRLDKGKSRDEVYAENRLSPRILDDDAKLELLLLPIEKVKVTRMGVKYRGLDYLDPALAQYFGQHVSLKVDPADVRTVGVWTLDMTRKIAEAACLELAPWGVVTDAQIKAVNQRVDESKRVMKKASEIGVVAYNMTNKQTLLAEVRRAEIAQAPQPPALPEPDSIRIAHTPLDGQSIDVQRPLLQLVDESERINLLDTDGEDF